MKAELIERLNSVSVTHVMKGLSVAGILLMLICVFCIEFTTTGNAKGIPSIIPTVILVANCFSLWIIKKHS